MSYVVRVWCPDCCGEDFLGCYDGVSELVSGASGHPTEFASIEAARDAGEAEVKNTIYYFQIERPDESRRMLVNRSEPLPPAGPSAAPLTRAAQEEK